MSKNVGGAVALLIVLYVLFLFRAQIAALLKNTKSGAPNINSFAKNELPNGTPTEGYSALTNALSQWTPGSGEIFGGLGAPASKITPDPDLKNQAAAQSLAGIVNGSIVF